MEETDYPLVDRGILRSAADRYRDWKNDLHEHFLDFGGDEAALDLDLARRSTPENLTDEVWEKCVDMFNAKEYRVCASLYIFYLFVFIYYWLYIFMTLNIICFRRDHELMLQIVPRKNIMTGMEL